MDAYILYTYCFRHATDRKTNDTSQEQVAHLSDYSSRRIHPRQLESLACEWRSADRRPAHRCAVAITLRHAAAARHPIVIAAGEVTVTRHGSAAVAEGITETTIESGGATESVSLSAGGCTGRRRKEAAVCCDRNRNHLANIARRSSGPADL